MSDRRCQDLANTGFRRRIELRRRDWIRRTQGRTDIATGVLALQPAGRDAAAALGAENIRAGVFARRAKLVRGVVCAWMTRTLSHAFLVTTQGERRFGP